MSPVHIKIYTAAGPILRTIRPRTGLPPKVLSWTVRIQSGTRVVILSGRGMRLRGREADQGFQKRLQKWLVGLWISG